MRGTVAWHHVVKPVPDAAGSRRDIQGIRALAVVAVLANHALGWPTGGFAGVDVFFVVSGFLITGILVREYEATGTISAASFYRRRAKRILPAATLVLVVTVVVSSLVMLSSRAVSVAIDALWAALFAANWRFASVGTDYFAQGAAVSPVQHYWSLSVEEQFYFVWPWLLLGLLVLIHRVLAAPAHDVGDDDDRERVSTRRIATVAMAVIVVASLAWAAIDTGANPTVAYFSTWTRAWELGVGAMLATTTSWWARLPDALRPWLSWAGLVGVVTSMLVITDASPFPFPWAVLPVVFTGLMVVAGIGREPRHAVVLTNPLAQYFGDISYSLYLWHFPVLVIGAVLLPDHWVVRVGLLGIGLILATGSYYLFEGPLHRSPWLSHIPEVARPEAWAAWRARFAPSMRFFAPVTAIGLGVSLVACWAIVRNAEGQAGLPADLSVLPAVSVPGPATSRLQAELSAAVRSTEWPDLVPSLASAADDRGPQQADGCLQPVALDPAGCRYGTGEKTALLVGDSYAVASAPMVQAALEADGYTLHVAGWYSCGVTAAALEWPSQPGFEADCARAKEQLPGYVEQVRPDLLIVLDSEVAYEGIATAGRLRAQAWTEGRVAAVGALQRSAGRTLLVTANPLGKDVTTCATVFSTPQSCAAPIGATWVEKYRADADAASALGIDLVDTRALFSSGGTVPAFAGGTPQRFDSGHLTQTYAQMAAPALREALTALP